MKRDRTKPLAGWQCGHGQPRLAGPPASRPRGQAVWGWGRGRWAYSTHTSRRPAQTTRTQIPRALLGSEGLPAAGRGARLGRHGDTHERVPVCLCPWTVSQHTLPLSPAGSPRTVLQGVSNTQSQKALLKDASPAIEDPGRPRSGRSFSSDPPPSATDTVPCPAPRSRSARPGSPRRPSPGPWHCLPIA